MPSCKSCGAQVIWCKTANGKNMPVDVNKVDNGNLILEDVAGDTIADYVKPGEGDYVSHFSTCPNASSHRRRPPNASG